MLNLINELNFPGLFPSLVHILALVTIFFGISVIITKNPVLSVLFLIGLFSTIAIYLMTLGLHFIGLSYVLVYIGAISILFLFILMLINVRISELVTDNKNSIALAAITVVGFSYCVNGSLPVSTDISLTNISDNFITMMTPGYSADIAIINDLSWNDVCNVTSKAWDAIALEISHISLLGNILYTNVFIFFILTSIILLLSMVGAIVTTVNKPISKITTNTT